MENYESFIDYYKVLGVDRTASEEEIKAAYRKLAKEYHPDKHQDKSKEEIAQYEELFKRVHAAYEHIGNESKNNNRANYDREYDQYYATKRQREEEARQQQERRRQQQESRSHTSSRTQSGTHARQASSSSTRKKSSHAEESGFKKAFSDIKTAWQEVRAEEKKKPFLKRHKTLNGRIYRNYYKENGSNLDDFVFILKSGSLHVFAEMLYQLEKLTHITEDTVPKYVIRNRAMAYVLALVMVLSAGALNNGENTNTPSSQDSYSVNQPDSTPDIIDDGSYKEEQEKKDEVQEEQDYVVMRTYTIKQNDTLSQLAEDANTTVESIMAVNNLTSPDVIKYGETLYIPYVIESEDLRYSTVAAYYQPGTDISTFAARYGTDALSIIALNQEAIEDGKVISDTLLVPTFASQSEIAAQKGGTQYTYKNGQ